FEVGRWRVLSHALDRLAHLVDLGLAHGLFKLVLEICRGAPEPARVMTNSAHHPRQVLRPNHDDRHHGDDQKLRPTDVEHERGLRARLGSATRSMPFGSAVFSTSRTDLGRAGFDFSLVLDDLGLRRRGGLGRLLLVLGHALLETLDALRDVAHQLGNLAAPEQKHEQHEHDQNMRPAQSHYGLQREGLSRASNSGHYGSKGAPVASRAPAYCKGGPRPVFRLEYQNRARIDGNADLPRHG